MYLLEQLCLPRKIQFHYTVKLQSTIEGTMVFNTYNIDLSAYIFIIVAFVSDCSIRVFYKSHPPINLMEFISLQKSHILCYNITVNSSVILCYLFLFIHNVVELLASPTLSHLHHTMFSSKRSPLQRSGRK